MVTPDFRTFTIMTVQDRLALVPKARLDVINSIVEKQEDEGLFQ